MASQGEFFEILSTFGANVRIIHNKMNVEYKIQETLIFTIYSFLPRSPSEIGRAVISQGKSVVIDYFLVFIGVHPVRYAKPLSHGVNSWLI